MNYFTIVSKLQLQHYIHNIFPPNKRHYPYNKTNDSY